MVLNVAELVKFATQFLTFAVTTYPRGERKKMKSFSLSLQTLK